MAWLHALTSARQPRPAPPAAHSPVVPVPVIPRQPLKRVCLYCLCLYCRRHRVCTKECPRCEVYSAQHSSVGRQRTIGVCAVGRTTLSSRSVSEWAHPRALQDRTGRTGSASVLCCAAQCCFACNGCCLSAVSSLQKFFNKYAFAQVSEYSSTAEHLRLSTWLLSALGAPLRPRQIPSARL